VIGRCKHRNESVGFLLQKGGFLKYLIDYKVLRKAPVSGSWSVGWFVEKYECIQYFEGIFSVTGYCILNRIVREYPHMAIDVSVTYQNLSHIALNS